MNILQTSPEVILFSCDTKPTKENTSNFAQLGYGERRLAPKKGTGKRPKAKKSLACAGSPPP